MRSKNNFPILILGLTLWITSCKNNNYDYLLETGENILPTDSLLIGNIRDVFYHNENLFILDNIMYQIIKLNTKTNSYESIKLSKGNGPGEVGFGLSGILILNDKEIVIVDQVKQKLIKYNNNVYDKEVKLKTMPTKVILKKDRIFIIGDSEYHLQIFDQNMNYIKSSIKNKFENDILWFPEVFIDDDYNCYITNPYKTEIIKYNQNGKMLWSFSKENLDLVQKPQSLEVAKGSAYVQFKGWSNIIVYEDIVYAFTFNIDNKDKDYQIIKIIALSSETGELLNIKRFNEHFRLYYSDENKKLFMSKTDSLLSIYNAKITNISK